MFTHFTRITFKLSKFTDVKAFFPATLKKFYFIRVSMHLAHPVSHWRQDDHLHRHPSHAVCRAKIVHVLSFLSFFETLSICWPRGIDPTTSCSSVKGSTDWTNLLTDFCHMILIKSWKKRGRVYYGQWTKLSEWCHFVWWNNRKHSFFLLPLFLLCFWGLFWWSLKLNNKAKITESSHLTPFLLDGLAFWTVFNVLWPLWSPTAISTLRAIFGS